MCRTMYALFPTTTCNPYTNIPDKSTQPPFGTCKHVDPNNTNALCVGDDTIHVVFPHAYSWPNDPQVYADDAPLYRVIFAPGGTTIPITPAGSIPACKNLPSIYDYAAPSLSAAYPSRTARSSALRVRHPIPGVVTSAPEPVTTALYAVGQQPR